MASFSQRNGIKPLQKILQVEELDQELRTGLWNVVKTTFLDHWQPAPSPYSVGHSRSEEARAVDVLVRRIWAHYFKLPLDEMLEFTPNDVSSKNSPYRRIRWTVMSGPWHACLDLLEFMAKSAPVDRWSKRLIEFSNAVFEAENSAYRFIDKEIGPITDKVEISEIETALAKGTRLASDHLRRALEMLSDRTGPDYRNSMKESISAVEAVSQIVAGKPGATLNDCMKRIKGAGHTLHPLFERSVIDLYNYTSDSGGIRHALNEKTLEPTYADAKYLLVLCSAFVNFLWAVAAETKLQINA